MTELWPANAFPLEAYDEADGIISMEPFGENISTPKSREIPPAFCGNWKSNFGSEDLIASDEIVIGNEKCPVIAVRNISDHEISVVTQTKTESGWVFALGFLGLEENGAKIRNLEDYDEFWVKR